MDSLRLSLFFFILCLCFFLFYLLYQRHDIYKYTNNDKQEHFKKNESFKEGMTEDKTKMEKNDIYNATNSLKKYVRQKSPKIKSSQYVASYPLMQLVIKGSANSAYSGSTLMDNGYISRDCLKYILARGCRFVDFQVYLHDNTVYVGYFKNINNIVPDHVNQINVLFKDILKDSVIYGMSKQIIGHNLTGVISYEVPNYQDPLFIQIRLNNSMSSTDKLTLMQLIQTQMQQMAQQYSSYFNFTGVNSTTFMKDLMGKIIFVFEKDPGVLNQNVGFYTNLSTQFNVLFYDDCNINYIPYSQIDKTTYKANPPMIKSSNDADGNSQSMTNVETFNIVYPDNNATDVLSNVNIFSATADYGCQIVLMQYYMIDIGSNCNQYLNLTETMFDNFGYAFIPLSNSISYVKTQICNY